MVYDKKAQLEEIRMDITRSTYDYFKNHDRDFINFIYGDRYYQTLENIIYLFLNKYAMGIISHDKIHVYKLVSDLYTVYTKLNNYLKDNNKIQTERHKKNYIHRVLRKKALKFLFQQNLFEENNKKQSDIDKVRSDNLSRLRCTTLYGYDEDRYVEEGSYKKWKERKDELRDIIVKKNIIRSMYPILNETEKRVIILTLKKLEFYQMAKILGLSNDQIRKIFHRAKNKLVKKHKNNLEKIKNGKMETKMD